MILLSHTENIVCYKYIQVKQKAKTIYRDKRLKSKKKCATNRTIFIHKMKATAFYKLIVLAFCWQILQ